MPSWRGKRFQAVAFLVVSHAFALTASARSPIKLPVVTLPVAETPTDIPPPLRLLLLPLLLLLLQPLVGVKHGGQVVQGRKQHIGPVRPKAGNLCTAAGST